MGVRGMDLLLHFAGNRSWNGVHFLQLVLRLIDRNLPVFLNPLGSDSDLWDGQLNVPDLGRKTVIKFTCMLLTPTGEFCFERPRLNKTLDALWDSAGICSGSSDFDGGTTSWVVGATSWWSEYLDVTQYITNAFTMTCDVLVSKVFQIH